MRVAEFVASHADALRAGADPATMVSPDAMGAVAAHVEREYGYGYRIGLVAGSFGAGLFAVVASDGGRFRLYADRYGNVARVPEEAHA